MSGLTCIYKITWICLVLSATIYAQDVALTLAEGLIKTGNPEEAITEYKRFICFNTDKRKESQIYFKIGMAYRNDGQFQNAIEAFNKAMSKSSIDSVRDAIRVNIGIVLIAEKAYSAAEFELLRVRMFSKNPFLINKANFYLGVCYLYKYEWDKAQIVFSQYFYANQQNNEKILTLFSTENLPRNKSPKCAKWLSTLIPGSGQIYGGNLLNGINATGINFGIGYLLVDSILDHRYADALIGYLSLFERYYRGNRLNAERIAKEFNENSDRHYAAIIFDHISGLLSKKESKL